MKSEKCKVQNEEEDEGGWLVGGVGEAETAGLEVSRRDRIAFHECIRIPPL